MAGLSSDMACSRREVPVFTILLRRRRVPALYWLMTFFIDGAACSVYCSRS